MSLMHRESPAAAETEQIEPVNRLCNEIQLFDLCELQSCSFKSGSFCTNRDLLTSFEKIADVEERLPEGVCCDESDDDENMFGDDFEDEDFGDEPEDFEQE
jgi:hypothetical protein